METADCFWNGILKWYSKFGRNYSWRKTSNPFYILTAEFLLQQTHVRKVEEVYQSFIFNYPTPEHLADSELAEVIKIIQPIGLKYRAERLKKCAEIICSEFNGKVPDSSESLKKLPGVGSYISSAVLCYAFGHNTVPIDTNVIRVFCRFFGFKSNKSRPRTDSILADKIKNKYSGFNSTKEANLAILDFAALVCTASRPKCGECPVLQGCSAFEGRT